MIEPNQIVLQRTRVLRDSADSVAEALPETFQAL